jgi:hypothetical protein
METGRCMEPSLGENKKSFMMLRETSWCLSEDSHDRLEEKAVTCQLACGVRFDLSSTKRLI